MTLSDTCLSSCGFVLDAAGRLLAIVEREGREDALFVLPAPGMFPAGRQIATAVGFTVRVACPLAGRAVPALPDGDGAEALRARIAAARERLADLSGEEFEGAEARVIRHRAGFADLEQTGQDFLLSFGIPNMMFHLTAAHVALKAAGLPVGKADFDGLHAYPPGFSFRG